MQKILVTFASKYHATTEIAEAIASDLKAEGVLVDLLPVKYVKNLESYDAIIIGSAVYAGRWIPEAVEFVKMNQEMLAEKPVWIFSSGPVGEGDAEELLKGWRLPEDLKVIMAEIGPRDIAVFHGKLDPDNLRLWERLIVKAMKAPLGDYRDWKAIHTWAGAIRKELLALAH